MCSHEKAKNMPPHHKFDHEIHLENDQMPPHSHIYRSLAQSSASFVNS